MPTRAPAKSVQYGFTAAIRRVTAQRSGVMNPSREHLRRPISMRVVIPPLVALLDELIVNLITLSDAPRRCLKAQLTGHEVDKPLCVGRALPVIQVRLAIPVSLGPLSLICLRRWHSRKALLISDSAKQKY